VSPLQQALARAKVASRILYVTYDLSQIVGAADLTESVRMASTISLSESSQRPEADSMSFAATSTACASAA